MTALDHGSNHPDREHDQTHDGKANDVGVLAHVQLLLLVRSMMAPKPAKNNPKPRTATVHFHDGKPAAIVFSSTPKAATSTPASRRKSPDISAKPLGAPIAAIPSTSVGTPWQ